MWFLGTADHRLEPRLSVQTNDRNHSRDDTDWSHAEDDAVERADAFAKELLGNLFAEERKDGCEVLLQIGLRTQPIPLGLRGR
jgi:hypothetical protein